MSLSGSVKKIFCGGVGWDFYFLSYLFVFLMKSSGIVLMFSLIHMGLPFYTAAQE